MSKTFLVSILLLSSIALHAEENTCKNTPLDAAIEKIQSCLQMECPSEQIQSSVLGETTTFGFSGGAKAISAKNALFFEKIKAKIGGGTSLNCGENCNFHYLPSIRLHTAPTSVIPGVCDAKYTSQPAYHVEYKTALAMTGGKESSCKPIVEKRAGDFIANSLTCAASVFAPCNKHLEDDSVVFQGKKVSSVEFSKILSESLCPGDCSFYSVQTTSYEKTQTACQVVVNLDISCGEAKKDRQWKLDAELVEAYQCVQR
jgi:hypothetical protein